MDKAYHIIIWITTTIMPVIMMVWMIRRGRCLKPKISPYCIKQRKNLYILLSIFILILIGFIIAKSVLFKRATDDITDAMKNHFLHHIQFMVFLLFLSVVIFVLITLQFIYYSVKYIGFFVYLFVCFVLVGHAISLRSSYIIGENE